MTNNPIFYFLDGCLWTFRFRCKVSFQTRGARQYIKHQEVLFYFGCFEKSTWQVRSLVFWVLSVTLKTNTKPCRVVVRHCLCQRPAKFEATQHTPAAQPPLFMWRWCFDEETDGCTALHLSLSLCLRFISLIERRVIVRNMSSVPVDFVWLLPQGDESSLSSLCQKGRLEFTACRVLGSRRV